MKKVLRFLLIAVIIGALCIVLMKAAPVLARRTREVARGRAPAPGHPTPWEAPTVEGPEAEVEPRVRESEEEGMTPAAGEQPVDVARGSAGEAVVSELAAPGAAEELLRRGQGDTGGSPDLDTAAAEGMTPPPQAPAEDVPISSSGVPLVSEFAAVNAEEAVLDAEAALLEALAESEAFDDATAEFIASLEGSPTLEESPLDTALHEPPSAEQNLELRLDEAEAQGRATADQEERTEAAIEEPAMPQTPVQPVAPIEVEPEVRADENLLSSVEEALDDLEPAPIVPPPRRSAESYLDEGNVYFNVGQYGLAIERYGQAIDLDSELTAAYYNRANAHTRAGDFARALADYNRALELQPMDADALNNRGMLHLYRANYGQALSDFNQALEVDPSDATVMVNRGLAQLHSGNAAAALVDFREAAGMDSADAAAQYGAAQASASLGNKDEALRHVARALELDPSYAREAAGDPRLQVLQGDEEFLRLLRESGSRSG